MEFCHPFFCVGIIFGAKLDKLLQVFSLLLIHMFNQHILCVSFIPTLTLFWVHLE